MNVLGWILFAFISTYQEVLIWKANLLELLGDSF